MINILVSGKQVLQNTFSKDYTLKDMDLVFLDIYLGEIDGYEVLKNITTSYPDLPVIMMSVDRKKENVLKSIELGANVDRATRVNTPLTVLILKIDTKKEIRHDILNNLKENLSKILRRIDSVFVYERSIILILPLTNKNGLKIVKSRISKVFMDAGIHYSDMREEIFFFPDDVKEKELIQNFDNYKIKDLILQKIKDTVTN
ncbi:MAG: response regulator [Peptococcaceae bacterium]|nr:response regulator [Peptococcaceae bacterium]